MKNEQNAFLRDIYQKKILLPEIGGGEFSALKLSVSGFDPNTNYVITVDIVLREQSCLCASIP